MTKGKRDNSHFLFLLILAVLSALAIWFVEEERPRREEAQSGVVGQTATVRLATTQARQTTTIRTRLTTTAYGRKTATTLAHHTAGALTVEARRAATATARVTALTRTPPPARTLTSLPMATLCVNSGGGANARSCPRHQTDPCEVVAKFAHGAKVTVVGEILGESYRGSRLWKAIEYPNQTLFIHASLLSRQCQPPISPVPTLPPNPTALPCSACCSPENAWHRRPHSQSQASYPGLTCDEIWEQHDDANFERYHPAYSSIRDGEGDGCACEK